MIQFSSCIKDLRSQISVIKIKYLQISETKKKTISLTESSKSKRKEIITKLKISHKTQFTRNAYMLFKKKSTGSIKTSFSSIFSV
jgi:hypothetical protein